MSVPFQQCGKLPSKCESGSTRERRLNDILADHGGHIIRIVHSDDGGPLRRIINGRQTKPTGRFPSYKGGASFGYEADHEMGLLEHCDADAAVIGCLSQPHRVEIPVEWQKRPLVYIPDLRRDLADRKVEIIESKSDDDPRLSDPDYEFKLDVVRTVYSKMGWTFRVLKRAEIMETRLYQNVHDVVPWAFATVRAPLKFKLRDAIIASGGTLPFEKATELLGGTPRLYALVVRRVVQFDLTQPIERDTPIRLVDRSALLRSSPTLL